MNGERNEHRSCGAGLRRRGYPGQLAAGLAREPLLAAAERLRGPGHAADRLYRILSGRHSVPEAGPETWLRPPVRNAEALSTSLPWRAGARQSLSPGATVL